MGRKGFPGNSTVTLTHSYTKNIAQITTQADIIITALGVPNYLKAEMVKDGAVVIDVGITRVADENDPRGYRITGDVDFDAVSKKASHITPVPVFVFSVLVPIKYSSAAWQWSLGQHRQELG